MIKLKVRYEGNVAFIVKKVLRIIADEVICKCLHSKCRKPECVVVDLDHEHKTKRQLRKEARAKRLSEIDNQ